jgi:hypothetical protein
MQMRHSRIAFAPASHAAALKTLEFFKLHSHHALRVTWSLSEEGLFCSVEPVMPEEFERIQLDAPHYVTLRDKFYKFWQTSVLDRARLRVV